MTNFKSLKGQEIFIDGVKAIVYLHLTPQRMYVRYPTRYFNSWVNIGDVEITTNN